MLKTKTICLERDLLYIILWSLLLALFIALGDRSYANYGRIILGLPLVLFFPGYVLIAAMFPGKADLGGIERAALSFGLSIAVAPMIGLGLNYTPWGIRLVPVLVSLLIYIFLLSGITFYRRRKIARDERFVPTFDIDLPVLSEMPKLEKISSVILVLAILFTAGSIAYAATVHKTGEKFTEFYILGPGGKAGGYPTDLTVGQQTQVIVGVVNHEYSTVNYTIQVKNGEHVQATVQPVILDNGQKWEKPVAFVFYAPHEGAELQFLLFRQGDTSPYRSLHLWVTVKASAPRVP
jgi:uncharacterized membrane protein